MTQPTVRFSVILLGAVVVLHAAEGVSGQLRLFSMAEENQDPLLDYHGTAVGGKLLYQTPDWNGVYGAVGFYTTHFVTDNVSTQRTEALASGRGSRYVVGLVDSVDPDANSVTNIGEAYLRLQSADGSVSIGRMKLETPFINAQDGRMIPTFEQGIWGTKEIGNGWQVQGGYINGFWNRNTPEWKSVEDSLGYGYEMGYASLDNTVKSDYYGNTVSRGVVVANVRYQHPGGFRADVWDYYVDNIFNLGYVELSGRQKIGKVDIGAGVQLFHQYEVGEGGNGEDNVADATDQQKAKSYFQQGEKSTTYGAKLTARYADSVIGLAYNATTDQGRFLFPREWGKEPLYTFQKRERSEGSGNCEAWLATVEHDFSAQGVQGFALMAGYGEYRKSDPREWRYNKYGTPGYAQWNVDLFYRFAGPLKGLRAEYLMARKVARAETSQIPGPAEYNFVFRKNGMTLHNFILTYDF